MGKLRAKIMPRRVDQWSRLVRKYHSQRGPDEAPMQGWVERNVEKKREKIWPLKQSHTT